MSFVNVSLWLTNGTIMIHVFLMQDNAVVINSIIGWKSSIGRWSRVQASGDDNERLGVTILGNIHSLS